MSRRNEAGITFWEVAETARAVGKAHGGHIRFSLDLPLGRNVPKAFHVRCALWKRAPHGDYFDARGVSEPWPNVDSRTFSGLLYRLAIQLDIKLSEEEAEAARGTLPLWPESS
jgi:hypothetical protein